MKRRINVTLLFLALYIFSFGISFASGASEINLSMENSQAIASALDQFRGAGYKLNGYQISIKKNSKQIEVIFIPSLKPSNNLIGATLPDMPEIHYYLDSSGQSVLRRLDGQ